MDSRNAQHPPHDLLVAFGLGKVDDSHAGEVARHLEECSECRGRVAELSGDSFLGRLQAVRRDRTEEPRKSLSGLSRGMGLGEQGVPPELASHSQYTEVRELGRGGMGVVYLAKNRLMDRPEVLKVVNRALLDQPGALDRFLREIRAAARLQHPNVVAAFAAMEVGELLVFAMEYVPGDDLAKLVHARGPLPVVNACWFAYQAALGLQHAHEKGMVHRDIKPSNLMLLCEGKKQTVKILDFGLAKATRDSDKASRDLTAHGMLMGTPDYVAPEQSLDATAADIRADVYALGCTLYFLLAGRPPFTGRGVYELVTAHHDTTATPLDEVRPEVPAGLAAVVARMMAKSPADRYQTPAEVAQALTPFFRSGANRGAAEASRIADASRVLDRPQPVVAPREESIIASPPKAVKRSRTKSQPRADGRRFPIVLVGIAGAIVLLGAAAFVLTMRNRDPGSPRKAMLVLQVEPVGAEVVIDDQFHRTVPNNGWLIEYELDPGRHRVRVQKEGFVAFPQEVELFADHTLTLIITLKPTAKQPSVDRQSATVTLDVEPADAEVTRDGQKLPPPTDEKRPEVRVEPGEHTFVVRKAGFVEQRQTLRLRPGETAPLRVRLAPDKLVARPETGHGLHVSSVAYSPDGRWIASASWDGTIKIWDAQASTVIRTLTGHTDWVYSLAFLTAFGAKRQLLVSGGKDKSVKVWDVESGTVQYTLDGHTLPVYSVGFSPDGRRVVSADGDYEHINKPGVVKVWNLETRTVDHNLTGHKVWVYRATFSPDGRHVASGDWAGVVLVHDAQTGQRVRTLQEKDGPVPGVAFSRDSRRLATTSLRGVVKLWNVETGQLQRTSRIPELNANILSVVFSPDGRRVVTGGALGDGPGEQADLRVWDARSGEQVHAFKGHTAKVNSVAFSPDGQRLVSGGWDKAVKVWEMSEAPPAARLPGEPLWIWHGGPVTRVAFSPDRKTFASCGWGGKAKLWDAETGREVRTFQGHAGGFNTMAFSPDGKRLASGSGDRTIKVWEVETGNELFTLTGHMASVLTLAFSPKGTHLMSGAGEHDRQAPVEVKVWNLVTRKEQFPLVGHKGWVREAAYTSDERLLVTSSADGTVKFWNPNTGTEQRPLGAIDAWGHCVAVSPDSRRLLSGSLDGLVRVWDLPLRKLVLNKTHQGPDWSVSAVEFSPDGRRFVTAACPKGNPNNPSEVQVWDARTGQKGASFRSQPGHVGSVAFSPDSKRVACGCWDGTIAVWDLPN